MGNEAYHSVEPSKCLMRHTIQLSLTNGYPNVTLNPYGGPMNTQL